MKDMEMLCGVAIVIILSVAPFTMAIPIVSSSEQTPTHEESGKTWVEIDPIQCGHNPWESNWPESNNDSYSSYPREVQEIEKIKNYYQKQGIFIFDVRLKLTHEIVCLACCCPRGDTLYVLVSDSDVNKMLQFGYEISEGGWDVQAT